MRFRIAACAFAFATLLSASTFAQEQEAPSRPPEIGPLPKPAPQRIRLGASAAADALVTQVEPKYPEAAKSAHICGTILLHAIIGKDGSMQQLEYISGPRLLLHSAMDAVRQWRYRPMILDGQPVEVDTKISVAYTMEEPCNDSAKDNASAQSDAATDSRPAIEPQLKIDIEDLFAVSHGKERARELARSLFEKLRPQILGSLPSTPNRDKIMDAYSKEFVSLYSSDNFIDQVVAVYAKYFIDDDIKGMIHFFQTPAGQHYLAKLPQITVDLTRIKENIAKESSPRIMKELCKEYPELQGEAKLCAQPEPEKKSLLIEPALDPRDHSIDELSR
jgi:Gram-negative bacterial TonB protein C-terminal/Uncharacterized protein conserved in bacteria (DUF2059)